MTNILQLLKRKLTSSRLDAKLTQAFCWTGSIAMMVAGIWKLSSLQLTEAELFFGILLVMTLTLLGIIAGLLIPIVEYVAQQQQKDDASL